MHDIRNFQAIICVEQSTILPTLICLNAISKLYFSREHIVTNFVITPAQLLNGTIQILYYYYYYLVCSQFRLLRFHLFMVS